jgi:putative transposase
LDKKKRFTPEQIIRIIKEPESGSGTSRFAAGKGYLSRPSSKYGVMEVSDTAIRLKVLEDENQKLKGLVADLSLVNKTLKDLTEKTSIEPKANRVAFRHNEKLVIW